MNAVKKPRKKVEKRVCWTARERAAVLAFVAGRLVELYKVVPPLDKLHKAVADLANEAQIAVLPVDRHRKLLSFFNVRWDGFEEQLQAALEKAQEARKASAGGTVPPPEKPATDSAGGFLDALADEMLATKKWRSLEDQLSETLFRKLKARVEQKAFGKLEVELGLKPAAPTGSVVVQERPKGDELPRFVVAGLIPKEFGRLEEKFRGRVELVHVSVDANAKGNFEVCRTGQVLVATGTPHKFVGKVKSLTENYEMVNGGVSSFERTLEHKLAG